MLILGPIGFTLPWLLWGLLVLPVLWLLLRAVPPAPLRRLFPGVALLLGLTDRDQQAERTPWWLLLLRMLALGLIILGFAGPVLNPEVRPAGSGPVLILADGSWAEAPDWARREERIRTALAEAGRAGRQVALVSLTDPPPGGPVFVGADALAAGLPAFRPRAWEPDRAAMAALAGSLPDGAFDTVWLSDGIAREGRGDLAAALMAHGALTVHESQRGALALAGAGFDGGQVAVTVLRSRDAGPAGAEVAARGLDPAGIERELARVPATFVPGEGRAEARFDLPPELRNRITRFEIAGEASAGAVTLGDDALRRRKVAIVTGSAPGREGLELLAPGHFLRQALEPTADLIEGTIGDVLLADPDVIILADVARVAETDAVLDWLDEGGLLLRFAGPRLAASDIGRATPDPLLPVRLRAGGRSVGGSMSWGEVKALAPFPEGSPFHGLAVPADIAVTAQILAQPGPDLAARTIATLADGTPMVTRSTVGEGQIVLFHVAANAEWSSLPLSGLFVQMLERLAVTSRAIRPEAADLAGTTWVAERVLDAFGDLAAAGDLPGIPGERLAEGRTGPDLPPGLYGAGNRRVALNAVAPDRRLASADWPDSVTVEGLLRRPEAPLGGWLLGGALLLLMTDILATLALGGRLGGRRGGLPAGRVQPALVLAMALLAAVPAPSRAQTDPSAAADRNPGSEARLVEAAGHVVLAHVLSGDAEVDRIAGAGLLGLSQVLYARSSVEPIAPMAVDLERDELSVFTFLYWPVTATAPAPSPAAYARLNRYLRSGGMILFDTRDADIAGYGAATPEGRRLQALAAPLEIPPLEPMPPDHVLTRSFYLLQDFPGRHSGRAIWVEASPGDAEQVEGMPFRNLNDGVTPVVIGGNDWAAAWAVDGSGRPMVPIGRGLGGGMQREIAYRFGVNLIMHVLTGNYKSDQVHVPALLERLGQ